MFNINLSFPDDVGKIISNICKFFKISPEKNLPTLIQE